MPDVLSIIASLVTIVAQTGVIAEQQEQQPPDVEVVTIEINSRGDEILQEAIERRNKILSQTYLN